jgi:hypothetical protein
MSGIGYVRRGQEAQVDWSSVTRDVTGEINRISTDRQNQREKLEEFNRQALQAANEVELGDSQTLNQMVLDGSGQQKEFLLMQHKLLKEGLIKPTDYSRSVQTAKDNWKNFGASMKEMNQIFSESMQKLDNDEMGVFEQFSKQGLFEFGNVQNRKLFIDPETGGMFLGKIKEDGSISKDPKDLMNINSMRDFANRSMPKVDVPNELSKYTQKLGKVVEVLKQRGILTVEDAKRSPEYQDVKKQAIESILANDINTVSVLGDYLGLYGPEDFTYDESGRDGKILLKRKGGIDMPELTEDQKNQAREAIDKAFDAQMPKIETPTPTFAPQRDTQSEAAISRDRRDEEDLNTFDLAVRAGMGDPGAVRQILSNPNSIVSNMYTDPNGNLVIQYKDDRGDFVIPRSEVSREDLGAQVYAAIEGTRDGSSPGRVESIKRKYMRSSGTEGFPGEMRNIEGRPQFDKKSVSSLMSGGVDEKGNIIPVTVGDFVVNKIKEAGRINSDRAPLVETIISELPVNERVRPLLSQVVVSDASTGFGWNQKISISAPFLPETIINFDNESHLRSELVPVIQRILDAVQGGNQQGQSSQTSGGILD